MLIAIVDDPPYIMVNSSSGLPISGFVYELQNEIASRGQFTFKYIPVPGPTGSYTTWLLDLSKRIDLIDDWYADTPTRRSLGLRFVDQIVDASIIVVAPTITSAGQANTWGFFLPFTWNLWAAILGIKVLNALSHWMMDSEEDLYHCLYLAVGQFTGVEVGPLI